MRFATCIIKYPVVDIDDSLTNCVKKGKASYCLVAKDRKFVTLLRPEQLLRGFLEGKQKLSEIL